MVESILFGVTLKRISGDGLSSKSGIDLNPWNQLDGAKSIIDKYSGNKL